MNLLSIREITIEVSVMILLIGLIRRLLHRQLAPDFQYFLWIFVALRILIPVGMAVEVSLPQALQGTIVSTMFAEMGANDTNEVLTSADENSLATEKNGSADEETEAETLLRSDTSDTGLYTDFNQSGAGLNTNNERTDSETPESIGENDAGDEIQDSVPLSSGLQENSSIFFLIWLAGCLSLGLYMLIGNLRLFHRLKQERRLIGKLKNGLTVYFVPGCYCLAGVIHPAIYLDTVQIRDEIFLKNILRHEREHYRAHDNYWQLIRSVCLILQWHNPLVWWAYFTSKKDCELACDFRSVRRMDEKKRHVYGQSLLAVCGSAAGQGISLTTAMGGSRKFMEERIVSVMKPKKKKAATLSVVIVVLLVLIGAVSVHLNAKGSSGTQETVMDESPEGDATSLRVDIQIENYYITNIGDSNNLYYIDEDQVLWGCGYNYYGQLGQGTWDEEYHTEYVKIAENVVHVDYSSPGGFVIYLTEDHELYGFGSAADGALLQTEEFSWEALLGDKYNHREENAISTPVLLMENVAYASCGRGDVACMTGNGDVYIWGTIWSGEAYYGDWFFVSTPQKVLSDAVLVTGGSYNHAALLQDGTVWTWGYNYAGSCGVEISDDTCYISEPVCVAEDAVMVWTGRVSRNVNCLDISEWEGSSLRGLENTILLKNDGTYWACGVNVGEETKTLSSYWEAANYEVLCSDEFVQLSEPSAYVFPDVRTYDEETAATGEMEELSPQEAWRIVGENFFTQYVETELEESGENLLAVLESETVFRADDTKLYSWERAVVYMGEKENRLFFVQYYIFTGANGETGWLLLSNQYYVNENDGSCGCIIN